jgi:ketosteroid isomerase-like protein
MLLSENIPRPFAARRRGMKRFLSRTVPLIGALLLFGCGRDSTNSPAVSDPIFAVVRTQTKALNRRDANAALAVMHPDAPGLAATRQTTEQFVQTYDLIYMLQNLALESVSETEAKVRFTQVTQRASGPEFRNNRVTGIHTLRKHGGAWKLYSTQVLSIDYLEK